MLTEVIHKERNQPKSEPSEQQPKPESAVAKALKAKTTELVSFQGI